MEKEYSTALDKSANSKLYLFRLKIPKKPSKNTENSRKIFKILGFEAPRSGCKLELGKETPQVVHKQMTAGFQKDLRVLRAIFGLSIDDR